MTVRIKALPKSQRVIVGMTRNIHQHRRGIQNGLHTIGQVVKRQTKKLIRTGPKTGRIYRYRGRNHRASAPGQAPANRSGRLAKSANYKVSSWYRMVYGMSAEYAGYLENGTGKIKPRPYVIRAIRETQGQAVRIFYEEVDKVIDK